MLKLNLPVLIYKFADRYEAHAAIPFPCRLEVEHGVGLTAEVAVEALTRKIEATLALMGVEELSQDTLTNNLNGVELHTLMRAARERADSIAEDSRRPQVVDYGQLPISGRSATDLEAHRVHERLVGALIALKPLADIADAYDANGLDEARPDWVENGSEKFDPHKELYCGRGGKELLTLQHVLTARSVLKDTAAGRVVPQTFYRQKRLLQQIGAWVKAVNAQELEPRIFIKRVTNLIADEDLL